MVEQGRALLALGARAVLMKGGHLDGEAVDLLVTRAGRARFAAPRIDSRNLHGTGCVLSSAIAANIALGHELVDAVARPRRLRGGDRERARAQSWDKGRGR